MKKSIYFVLLLGMALNVGCGQNSENVIRISGAWALYPMMGVWSSEYQKTHDIKISLAGGGAGKGMTDILNGQVNIAMCSRPVRAEELKQGAFPVAVTKDAVIPTINDKNPVFKKIQKKGLTREEIKKVFLRKVTEWGELFGKEIDDDTITVYGRADASGAAKVFASYLGDYSQSDIKNAADANFEGDQALAQAVKNSKNSIGFNNLNYAYNIDNGKPAESISVVPLDLNGNGMLDKDEDFYDTRKNLVANVSSRKFPSPPARFEFVVAKNKFDENSLNFVRWILTEGQKFVPGNGYVKLSDERLQNELKRLENNQSRTDEK